MSRASGIPPPVIRSAPDLPPVTDPSEAPELVAAAVSSTPAHAAHRPPAGLGIAVKLGMVLAVFALFSVALTAYYLYSSSSSQLRQAAERDLLTAAHVLARNLTLSLENAERYVGMLSGLPDARRALEAERAGAATDGAAQQRLAEAFEALFAVQPNVSQIRLIAADRHGLERVRVDRDNDGLGTLRVSGEDLQEKAHFPYVFETLRRRPGEVYFSDISLNRETGAHAGEDQPTLRVAGPVADAAGRALGVVVVNIDVGRYFDRLRGDFPASYQIYLANHRGDYLVHPDPAQTFGFDHGHRILVQDSFPEVAPVLAGSVRQVLIESAPGHGPGGRVTAFVRLPFGDADDGRTLVLGLSQPLEEVFELFAAHRRKAATMVGVLGVLAVALSLLVARAVTGPVNAMVAAVTAFGSGRREGGLPVSRRDELGVLARSVAAMQEQIASQLTELERSRSEMDHLAHHDALTGLPNRRMFLAYLEAGIARARRSGKRFALVFVDLDRFKEINDRYGHAVGDAVLLDVAGRLKLAVRADDTVARLAGDEFTVMCENLDTPVDAVLIAQKLHDSFLQPVLADGQEVAVKASIGVGLYPEHGEDALALLRSADKAMYRVKLAGRNSYCLFDLPAEGEVGREPG